MVMVCRSVVLAGQMTGGAKCVALGTQLSAVRVVAVAASDTAPIHLALEKRTPIVDFVMLLAIGIVKRTGEQRGTIIVKKRLAGFVAVGDLTAPRMTLRADLDLTLGRTGLRADSVAGRRI